MKVKLSVIIPVYNGESTINKCIDSVLSQTLKEIEIIVVNDGSSDNTLGILNSYDDARIKIISIPNGGQGMARNRGLEIAEGEYVGFVDADDTINDKMYEVMYQTAKKHNADMVQCAINDIKSDGTQVRPQVNDEFVCVLDRRRYVRDYFYNLLHTNEVCNKIFSLDFLKNHKISFGDTKEIYSEDLKFNIDTLSYLNRVCFIKEPFYNYFISDNGHCKKSPEERLEKIFVLYKKAIENIDDKIIKRAVKSTAVITLMSYCAGMTDSETTGRIIKSKTVKNYMIASLLYKKTVKHTMLMLSLILCPMSLKRKIIVRQYTF